MKKSRLVLIGGAGYIGNVCQKFFLNKNYKILCIDNLIYNQSKPKRKKNLIFVRSDINEKEKIVKNIDSNDIVIYLAGLVGDPITKKYKKQSKKINETDTISLIKSLFKKKINHLIFISTCSNYGISKKDDFVNEKSPLNPISIYAKSKIKVETYLQKYSKNRNNSTKISILRFATAFGYSERMRFDLTINQFIKELYIDKNIDVYDPDTWRPYCHVKDFANGILKVMNSKKKNLFNIYNIGSNKNNFTKRMIANRISKLLKIKKVNFLKKSKDFRNYRVDFSKMQRELNFVPKYSINFGIKEILNFLKKSEKTIKISSNKKYGNFEINLNQ